MKHQGSILNQLNGYDVIDCVDCGFVHINPIPSDEVLQEIYQEEYYTVEKPEFIARQIEDAEWWNTVFDDRYDSFEEFLPPAKRSILDIGCGPGFFLKRGQQRGWQGLGIEPSRQAAANAKEIGVDVMNCFLEESGVEKKGRKFDAVHLSEVLEHTPDPVHICETAYNLLSENGVLCIVVPNDYNPFQEALTERLGFEQYWLAPPHHINYFTFDSLQKLLERVGFNVLKKEAMFPMEMFLMMGFNYVGSDEIGRDCHGKRKNFEINLCQSGLKNFKRELYEFLASKNVGREIVLYARKECENK